MIVLLFVWPQRPATTCLDLSRLARPARGTQHWNGTETRANQSVLNWTVAELNWMDAGSSQSTHCCSYCCCCWPALRLLLPALPPLFCTFVIIRAVSKSRGAASRGGANLVAWTVYCVASCSAALFVTRCIYSANQLLAHLYILAYIDLYLYLYLRTLQYIHIYHTHTLAASIIIIYCQFSGAVNRSGCVFMSV